MIWSSGERVDEEFTWCLHLMNGDGSIHVCTACLDVITRSYAGHKSPCWCETCMEERDIEMVCIETPRGALWCTEGEMV